MRSRTIVAEIQSLIWTKKLTKIHRGCLEWSTWSTGEQCTRGFSWPRIWTNIIEVLKDKSFLNLRKNWVSYWKNLPCSSLSHNWTHCGKILGLQRKREKKVLKQWGKGKKSVTTKTVTNQSGFRCFYRHEKYQEQERVWTQIVVT